MDSAEKTAWIPDLVYFKDGFESGRALVCDASGTIISIANANELKGGRIIRLNGRALLPGMVNAHSHSFQRVIRGRTEYRSVATARDSFWTWREAMYDAASRLTPDDIYDAARMAFLEMALAGITSVGEFHYLHRAPDGTTYEDPNLLAKQVCRAARDVGLRIALLRVAYVRSGFNKPPDERQRRFIEPDPETYLRNTEGLIVDLRQSDGPHVWVGTAPHSVRAVPLDYMKRVRHFADERRLPLHMHVAEQPAEISACLEETGRTPVALLSEEGILGPNFTGVHAVHVTPQEVVELGRAGATVCACPTTERNLGDGIVPANLFFKEGIKVALGTDSHVQIDLLEDARELDYHLRLRRLERNVLAPYGESSGISALATRLFHCATDAGAHSIGGPSGALEVGKPADFFTVDLSDVSIAGATRDDLLPAIVFSLARTAIREVAVSGRLIVEDGYHGEQAEVVSRFAALQKRLWAT
jgi:formimidoylglutamate deiminase